MAGHSHGHVHDVVEGIDQTTGGSTFGPNAGFAVISVKDGVLREAYWKAGQPAPDLKLLEKPIPAASSYPEVEIRSPAFRESGGSTLSVSARLAGPVAVEKATYTVDDEMKGELKLSGAGARLDGFRQRGPQQAAARRALPAGGFRQGRRALHPQHRVLLRAHQRPTAWRAYLAASSKVTPAIADGVVYVGANDGKLRALEASTGKELLGGRHGRGDSGRAAGGRREGVYRQRPGGRFGLHHGGEEAVVIHGGRRGLFLSGDGGGQGDFRLQRRLALRAGCRPPASWPGSTRTAPIPLSPSRSSGRARSITAPGTSISAAWMPRTASWSGSRSGKAPGSPRAPNATTAPPTPCRWSPRAS